MMVMRIIKAVARRRLARLPMAVHAPGALCHRRRVRARNAAQGRGEARGAKGTLFQGLMHDLAVRRDVAGQALAMCNDLAARCEASPAMALCDVRHVSRSIRSAMFSGAPASKRAPSTGS